MSELQKSAEQSTLSSRRPSSRHWSYVVLTQCKTSQSRVRKVLGATAVRAPSPVTLEEIRPSPPGPHYGGVTRSGTCSGRASRCGTRPIRMLAWHCAVVVTSGCDRPPARSRMLFRRSPSIATVAPVEFVGQHDHACLRVPDVGALRARGFCDHHPACSSMPPVTGEL